MLKTFIDYCHILGPIVASISLIYTVYQVNRKGSVEQLTQYMSLRLAEFKELLVIDLKKAFASLESLNQQREIVELQFKLRDERMQSLNERISVIDNRTKRNSERVAILMETVLPEQTDKK